MKLHYSILIPLVFLLTGCISSDSEEIEIIQTVQVELTETLSIGDGNPEDPNYLFASIASVSVDEQGFIYTTEYFDQVIKIFDKNGTFIDTIGSEGSGPGEFRIILTMSRDKSGNFIVMDQGTGSVSKFDDGGTYTEGFTVPNNQIRQIEALTEETYMTVYTDLETDTVLHIFDNNFELQDSFAHLETIRQTDERFEEIISRTLPGRFMIYDENTVYFAPVFYHGLIYKYQNEGETWNLTTELNGFTEVPAFFTVSSKEASDSTYVMPYGNETVAANINNESRGLFRTGDGNIIHFTLTRQDGLLVFGAEVFSAEGGFLGYTPIQKLADGNMYALHMEYDDQDHYVYVVELDEIEGTVLRRYHLEISEANNI